ncbi:MAG TPA: hypothetical protein VEQ61_02340, partial [Thermoleophilaceae bacterium]|nr:hypothetical protein [Thermoleophilaceae bacterium]
MAAAAQAKPAPESAPGELIEDGQRAYRFSTVAPLPGEVQRVARGRLAHAIEALAVTRGAGAEAAIHETRKDMKKLRAL